MKTFIESNMSISFLFSPFKSEIKNICNIRLWFDIVKTFSVSKKVKKSNTEDDDLVVSDAQNFFK